MIEYLLSSPGLIPGPLKPKPELILTQFQGMTLSTPKSGLFCFKQSYIAAEDIEMDDNDPKNADQDEDSDPELKEIRKGMLKKSSV